MCPAGTAQHTTSAATDPGRPGPGEIEVPALDRLDWDAIAAGFAVTEALLPAEQCHQ